MTDVSDHDVGHIFETRESQASLATLNTRSPADVMAATYAADSRHASRQASRQTSRRSSFANHDDFNQVTGEGLLTGIPSGHECPDDFEKMPRVVTSAYALGHVFNDLCAACWFTYLQYYLVTIQCISNKNAGYVMLAGQVTDAIATPIVGVLSDKTRTRFGRRKPWIFSGTVIVAIFFTFVFSKCFMCKWFDQPTETMRMVYYAICASLFNVGWAMVQVANLALCPELTICEHERTHLMALRYAGTVVSNMSVFVILIITSSIVGNAESEEAYQYLSYTVLVVGAVSIIYFFIFCKEKSVDIDAKTREDEENDDKSLMSASPVSMTHSRRHSMKWSDWFYEIGFYQTGFIYMCIRLLVNVYQVFLTFYVQEMHIEWDADKVGPLVLYIFSALISPALKYTTKRWGRKLVFYSGTLVCLISFAGLAFLDSLAGNKSVLAYFFIALTGIGSSALLISSMALIADLVGTNIESGAFVYGAMSFLDKLSCGVAIMIIQLFAPIRNDAACETPTSTPTLTPTPTPSSSPSSTTFFRIIISSVPAAACIAACLMVLTLKPFQKIAPMNTYRTDDTIRSNYSALTDETEDGNDLKKK